MDALVKWWFIFWSCTIGAVVAQRFDLFEKLWQVDATKLSFVIFGMFILVTGFIGVMINSSRKKIDLDKTSLNLPTCWFATEAMNALGMIGTVAGFIIMLSTAFQTTLDPNDINSIRQLITATAIGLSTAATTTLVGLICSTLTKLQLVILERTLDETNPQ